VGPAAGCKTGRGVVRLHDSFGLGNVWHLLAPSSKYGGNYGGNYGAK
jgi:hypothetical protein